MTEVYYDIGPCFSLVCRNLYDISTLIMELPQLHPVVIIHGTIQLETLHREE